LNQQRQGVGNKASAYDLAVAYRVCPKLSKHALSLPFGDDKYLLAELCLRSFRESLGDLQVKVWALLDGCPTEYQGLFKKYFRAEDLILIPLDSIGNQATFGRQIDVLLAQEASDLVYFAEDDYFYLPGEFPQMVEFIRSHQNVDFVSAYDHPECYRGDFYPSPEILRVSGNRHWRTTPLTCLTFLTRKETLRKCERVLRSYCRGRSDYNLWQILTKHLLFNPVRVLRYGYARPCVARTTAEAWFYGWRQILFGTKKKLWAPMPGIATHLANRELAPTIDWVTLMKSQKERIESEEVPLCAADRGLTP
jgi:hypothetical protein